MPLSLPEVLTDRIAIPVPGADAPLTAYRARPRDAAGHHGVVVAHELFGVTDHVRDVAARLAALGLTAVAPDLHHRTEPGVELAHDDDGRRHGFALLERMTRAGALADMAAAAQRLRDDGCERVSAVGLSMGGHVAYLAATEVDLDTVVVAYGGWIPTTDIPLSRPEPTVALTPSIRAQVLLLQGGADHAVDPEQRAAVAGALRAAGVRHEVVEYPGVAHGFLCDRRDTYDAAAADDAWRRIEALLAAS